METCRSANRKLRCLDVYKRQVFPSLVAPWRSSRKMVTTRRISSRAGLSAGSCINFSKLSTRRRTISISSSMLSGMGRITAVSYTHLVLFPQRIDENIAADDPVRIVNAVVDNLNLDNFKKLYNCLLYTSSLCGCRFAALSCSK